MSANPLLDLYRMLPRSPRTVGTVQSTAGSSSVVTLPDGSTLAVLGTASVGALVYIKEGAIETVAPSLPVLVITV